MPPAAKNLFEKRFLDFQKLFIKVCLGPISFAVKKIDGGFRENKKPVNTREIE
jgi:hypothetical protein